MKGWYVAAALALIILAMLGLYFEFMWTATFRG